METIPLKDLSSLVEDIHVKTGEASQNTDLDMREFSTIDRALQSIQGFFCFFFFLFFFLYKLYHTL